MAYAPRPGFEALAKELKSGKLRPAYLLWGDESFLIERAVADVCRAALGTEAEDDPFNVSRFEQGDATLSDALRQADELPMLRERRVVIFSGITSRDAYGFAKVHVKKAERDRLARYLSDPNPTTVLILTGSVADYKQSFLTSQSKTLGVYQMNAPAADRLLKWIPGKAKAEGVEVSDEAAEALLGAVGPSMQLLSLEIEKLALYADPGTPTSVETVRALVEGSTDDSVFVVSDALGRGDVRSALRTMRRVASLHADGDLRLLNELRRSVTLWFRIRERLDRGQDSKQIAGALRIPAFIVSRNLAAARRRPAAGLRAMLGELLTIERRMKQGRGDVAQALELLVLDGGLT